LSKLTVFQIQLLVNSSLLQQGKNKFPFKLNMLKDNSKFIQKHQLKILAVILSLISICASVFYYHNGLYIANSDSMSHLNIARRVIDSLTPGIAQIGSIWLPLPHLLMIPTIWSNFMWHSGLSGSLISMISYVVTGLLIFKLLKELHVNMLGRIFGVAIFALNPNILYLQSTAMTELLLLATMMAGAYYFFLWSKRDEDILLIKSAFWIMLSTLVRYDGWFLLLFGALVLLIFTWKEKGWKKTEGKFLVFCSLGGFGIVLWLLWNWAIFGDPLYFAFGQFSAHTQQEAFAVNGLLVTQHNLWLSTKIYTIAFMFNAGWPLLLLTALGIGIFYFNKNVTGKTKFVLLLFTTPFFFNIVALYLGHSILFMPGVLGSGWFNVCYGAMCIPIIAIFVPFLLNFKNKYLQAIFAVVVIVAIVMPFSYEAVTLQDAKEGMARKDLKAISRWLSENATNPNEKILISGAANDPIVFLSGFPMKRFIYEGSGRYWTESMTNPSKYATWAFVDKKNDRDLVATTLWETNILQKKFELVHEDEWFDVYKIISKPDLEITN